MTSTTQPRDKNTQKESSNSRAFDQRIAELFDEIQLSIQWNRPAILLAVHASTRGQETAKKALQKKLSSISVDVVQIDTNGEHSNLFDFVEREDRPDQFVYFVEGVGNDRSNYRALNLYREKLVEQKLIVVFWLTEKESLELPRLAPDFWAFRHRVIEFAPGRGSKTKALPSGILMWQAEIPSPVDGKIAEKIVSQQELLSQLPLTDDVLMLRTEAIYLLARYHWWMGEDERSAELLQRELDHLDRLQALDILATFLNGLAIISYDRGNYEEALRLLERAVQLNPGDQVLLANWAVVQHGMGKSGQAVQTIKKTIRTFPNSSWLWYILGYVQFSLGKMDQAVEAFQEASRLNADNIFAKYAIAVCQIREKITGTQLLQTSAREPNPHHEICIEALSGNKAAALDKLRLALSSGIIPLVSLKRDPTLRMIFDPITMEFLL